MDQHYISVDVISDSIVILQYGISFGFSWV